MPAPIQTNTQATSTTAAALPNRSCTAVQVHNNDAAINVLVGNSQAQNFTLPPGTHVLIQCTNQNQIWVKSASGTPTVSFMSF